MEMICDCGETMQLNTFEPDQDSILVAFYCEKCGDNINGTYYKGEPEYYEIHQTPPKKRGKNA